jgi:acyl-CoA synthetase (AMP-forming)/AMP-acid ligase II
VHQYAWLLSRHLYHAPEIFIDAATNRSYSFAQVKSTAHAFGQGLLAEWNWQKDDVLALYTPNSIDTPAIVWGSHFAGGIVTPANPSYTVEELVFQLQNSGAKALATQHHLLDNATKAARKVGIPENRIVLLGDRKDESSKFKHFTSIRSMASIYRYRKVQVKNPAKEPAFLVYSSGTTGLPKGVMLTHRNLVSRLVNKQAGLMGRPASLKFRQASRPARGLKKLQAGRPKGIKKPNRLNRLNSLCKVGDKAVDFVVEAILQYFFSIIV